MIRAPGPRAPFASGNAVGMWWILGLGWGLAAITALVWVAAWVAAALTGAHVPPFGESWIAALAQGHVGQVWPGTPTVLVACLATGLVGVVAGTAAAAWRAISRRLPRPGDPVAALRRNPGIQPLTPGPAASTAARLRGSLDGVGPGKVAPADIGLVLGDVIQPGRRGPALYAS